MAKIYFTMKLHRGKIPISFLGFLQGGLTCILIILQIIDFSFTFQKSDDTWEKLFPAAQPVIKATAFAIALFLQIFTRRKGIRSPIIIFIFWLFVAICSLPEFMRELQRLPLKNEYYHRKIHALTTLVCYPAIVIEFILNCFAVRTPVPSLQGRQSEKETKSEESRTCPQKSSSLLYQLTFQWMYPLLWKGYRGTLKFSDLWDLNEEDKSSVVSKRFMKYWQPELERAKTWNDTIQNSTKEVPCKGDKSLKGVVKNLGKKKTASVLPALWKSNWKCIVVSGVLKLFQNLFTFVSPIILSLLISHLETATTTESWKGYLYVVILFVTVTLQTFSSNYHIHLTFLIGMRLRCALLEAIYRKSLLVSSTARKESTVGEIVNLMSVDTQRFQDFILLLHEVWSAPLQIILALYLLWGYLGPATLGGVVVIVILIPINSKLTGLLKILNVEQMKKKDERIQLTSEILAGIQVLKLYAWETFFKKHIGEIRQLELDILRRLAYVNVWSNFFWFMAPVLISVASFGTYVLMDEANVLDAQKAFVSLTLFNILRLPLGLLPLTAGQYVQTQVSLKRINKFMNADEIRSETISHHYPEHGNPVSVDAGNFTWNEVRSATSLRNINLHVKKGALVAVVGTVGSGKSSLLSAILGELQIKSGRVNTWGSVAYVAQQAWIQNTSLQNNILFGRKLDPDIYNRIIEACALQPDIQILPGGDQTEIGDKGMNLSGGQKQRVALARAVYNDADIYLLDDPFSAVDSHVCKQLFEKVIGPKGMLRKKTRIVVTHGVTYLPYVDRIIVMNNGEITESGTFKDLLNMKKAFAKFVVQHATEDCLYSEIFRSDSDEKILSHDKHLSEELYKGSLRMNGANVVLAGQDAAPSMIPLMRLSCGNTIMNCDEFSEPGSSIKPSEFINAERTDTGNVKKEVYTYFVKSMGSVFSMTSLVSFVVLHGANIYSNFWLSDWTSVPAINGIQDIWKRNLYLAVYSALGLLQSIAAFLANIMLPLGCLRAAAILHNDMLSRILRTPMTFFDVTPIGRIINRFSKDVDVLDTIAAQIFINFFTSLFRVLGVIIVISINTPTFLLVIIPIAFVYIAVQRFYAATSRQLRRLESVSRSPIFSHFSETLAGVPTLRAFSVQDQFVETLEKHLDKNHAAYFPCVCANRWLSVLLECLGNIVVICATVFALTHHADAGSMGLSISYALSITIYLNYLVKQSLEVETNMVSVERIKEYTVIPQEAAWCVPSQQPGTDWPQDGNITFKNFQTRYRPDFDFTLRGITCNISSGEKVGIIGRTGAGKSSLTLSLFRILEAAGGSIIIDGKDISKMGLQDVRRGLTIIPQDSVLFAGSLRLNLDPSGKYSDDTIWHALEYAHLKELVASLTGGLNAILRENGGYFSSGQMQLVCLARALLRKTKILILDEATASVDLHTDDLIQQTIKAEFKDCTILTIAHRLNTIMDSDRVMVLDKGEICEFDSPQSLLSNHSSIFSRMVEDAGLL